MTDQNSNRKSKTYDFSLTFTVVDECPEGSCETDTGKTVDKIYQPDTNNKTESCTGKSCLADVGSVAYGEDEVLEVEKEIKYMEEKEDFYTEYDAYVPFWGNKVKKKKSTIEQPKFPLPKVKKISQFGLVELQIEPEIE